VRIQQHARVGVLRLAEQHRLVGHLDQTAEVHDAHLVGHVAHNGEVVRDEEVGQAPLALQVLHDVEDLRLHRHVQRRRRFVADEELGMRRERTRDRDALTLAARELVRELLGVRRAEADGTQQLADTLARIRIALDEAMLTQRLGDDVQHLPARVQRCVGILEDHLHAPAQLGGARA
jgi:hypothetical protein